MRPAAAALAALCVHAAGVVGVVGGVGVASAGERPYLSLEHQRRWQVDVVASPGALRAVPEAGAEPVDADVETFRFASLAVSVPFVASSGTGRMLEPAAPVGRLLVNGRPVDDSPEIVRDPRASGPYARWSTDVPFLGTARVECSWRMQTHRTVYDDDAASTVAWPAVAWPDDAQRVLDTPLFRAPVDDPDRLGRALDALVERWVGAGRTRAARPAVLAKFLAGKVQGHVRSIERRGRVATAPRSRLRFDPGAEPPLIEVGGLERLIETGRGTEHDLALLLAGLYRAAGLPARVVVGVEVDPDRADVGVNEGLRTWVEWCLYDEERDAAHWIPVDIARMRVHASRVADLGRPWRFFGTHPGMDRIVPVAFDLEPAFGPRSLRPPGLVGFELAPAPPDDSSQTLRYDVTTLPMRAGDRGGGP